VNKPLRVGMTLAQLFAGVDKKDDERFFLVISKLDVKTKHVGTPEEDDNRQCVETTVHWLHGLYFDKLTGMLRQLKREIGDAT
jgi:hypothetical protein